jgi:hypothetical protein
MFFVWLGAVCKNSGVLEFAQCWTSELLTPLGAPHLVDCLVLLAVVVLPAQPLHAVTKLLELLVTRLDLILAWPCCVSAMCTVNLYPVIFMNRCYTWPNLLSDAMAKKLP